MDDANNTYYFLQGGGEMGALFRAKDWGSTPLGAPHTWPLSLRTMVTVMLNNPFGMYIAWGKQYTQLYNDGYRPILGATKHPQALGNHPANTYGEIWHIIGPMYDDVLQGKTFRNPDFQLTLHRNGFDEICYFDFSYSPIRKEDGEVGGILVTVVESTDKVRATAALKESNLWFFNSIMQAPVAMGFFRGKEHVVDIVNDQMIQLWDTDLAQVIKKPLFAALPVLQNQGLEDMMNKVFYNGEKMIANERPIILRRHGKTTLTYISFIAQAITETDGTITGIVVIANEVTEQVLSRIKLIESEQKVRAVVENAPTPIAVYVGEDMRIEFANESILNIWGKGHDVIGKSFKEVLPELDNQLVFDQIKDVYQTGKPYHTFDTPLDLVINGAAKTFYFNYSFTPLYDISGRIYGVMNTGADLTYLYVAKLQLEESEQKFRLLANAMPHHIWTSNPHGYLNYCNPFLFAFTGLPPGQVLQQLWVKTLHPDDRRQTMTNWMESIETGKDFMMEHRFKRHDNTYRWHLSKASPQKDDKGHIQMWVGISTDIHVQKAFTKELERQVVERTNELEQNNISLAKMNKELQSFAYISSHDLQEPLRKIQNFTSLIMEKEGHTLNDNVKEKFQRIQHAAMRMQNLINDLLTYSRIDTNTPKFTILNLNTILNEVKEDLTEELEQKQAIIDGYTDCELPVIPFQIRQLLYNLFSNALKFAKPGIPPKIIITCGCDKGKNLPNADLLADTEYYHVSIADNGIGFEQEYSFKIFEVFQRLHGKNEYSGTGIGLAIVKKIIDNHHGIITAKGVPNEGATFDIFLPMH